MSDDDCDVVACNEDGEENGDCCSEEGDEGCCTQAPEQMPASLQRAAMRGQSSNTGPKGVLADYREAQMQLRAERVDKKLKHMRMMDKLAVGEPVEYVADPIVAHIVDPTRHPDDDDEDAELNAIRARRMRELQTRLPEFGAIVQIKVTEFMAFVDDVDPRTTVVLSLYKPEIDACVRLNLALAQLARNFSRVRFGQMIVTKALPQYDNAGLPALVVYRGGNQVHSFVPLTDHIRSVFSDHDLVRLLCEHDIVGQSDIGRVQQIILHDDSDDSDDDDEL